MTEEKQETSLSIAKTGTSIYSSWESFESAQRMAKSLSSSSFVPPAYQNNIPNTLIAMEVANRYGNMKNAPSVLAVMQNLYVVHGKPGFEAKFVIGLINTCGMFSPMRWKVYNEGSQTQWGMRAYCTDLRSGEELVGSLVDMEMANKEGWLFKKDKNGRDIVTKWQSMPEQMLTYRSASFWIKKWAPELLLGMSMADEIEDHTGFVEAEVIDGNPLDVLADKLTAQSAGGEQSTSSNPKSKSE